MLKEELCLWFAAKEEGKGEGKLSWHLSPTPLLTAADFSASLSFVFKISSLKPGQKFPATAYSDTEFSSPLLF